MQGPAPEGYAPTLPVILDEDFPLHAAGAFVIVDGLRNDTGFKRRRTSSRVILAKNFTTRSKLSQPAFFIDDIVQGQDHAALQMAGLITVTVATDPPGILPAPGTPLEFGYDKIINGKIYTVLQPQTSRMIIATVLFSDRLDGQSENECLCRAMIHQTMKSTIRRSYAKEFETFLNRPVTPPPPPPPLRQLSRPALQVYALTIWNEVAQNQKNMNSRGRESFAYYHTKDDVARAFFFDDLTDSPQNQFRKRAKRDFLVFFNGLNERTKRKMINVQIAREKQEQQLEFMKIKLFYKFLIDEKTDEYLAQVLCAVQNKNAYAPNVQRIFNEKVSRGLIINNKPVLDFDTWINEDTTVSSIRTEGINILQRVYRKPYLEL